MKDTFNVEAAAWEVFKVLGIGSLAILLLLVLIAIIATMYANREPHPCDLDGFKDD